MGILDRIRKNNNDDDEDEDDDEETEDGEDDDGDGDDDDEEDDEGGGGEGLLGKMRGLSSGAGSRLIGLGKMLKRGDDDEDDDTLAPPRRSSQEASPDVTPPDEEEETGAVAELPVLMAEPEPAASDPASVDLFGDGEAAEEEKSDAAQIDLSPASDPASVDLTGDGEAAEEEESAPGQLDLSPAPAAGADKGSDDPAEFSITNLFEEKQEIDQGLRDLAESQEIVPAEQLASELRTFLAELESL